MKSKFEDDLAKVVARIKEMPEQKQEALFTLVEQTRSRYEQAKESADIARTALADLRIMLKYMEFDKEATKREKNATRRSQ